MREQVLLTNHRRLEKRFSMRALVYQNNMLQIEKSYRRPDLQPGEALIKVLQAGICNTDLEIVRGYMNFQGVLGHEFVGIVETVHEGSGASALTSLIAKRSSAQTNTPRH